MVEEWVVILMVILSLIGIGVMRFSPTEGYWYWLVITLIFSLLAMLIGFVQAKQGQYVVRDILVEQSLLWLGVILALCGILILIQFGIPTTTRDAQAIGETSASIAIRPLVLGTLREIY